MGTDNFCTESPGATMRDAFIAAVDGAQWLYGHGGYTGTIAEKHGFIDGGMLTDDQANIVAIALLNEDAAALVQELRIPTEEAANLIATHADKYGPCVGFQFHQPGTDDVPRFVFMGLASS